MNIQGSRSASQDAVGRKSVQAVIVFGLLCAGRLDPAEAGVNVWTSQGPPGDPVLALAVDPLASGTVYAVCGYFGIFKTLDGGETWRATNSGMEGFFLDDIAFSASTPPVLYVAAYRGASGIYRSDDSGTTWTAMGPDLPPGVRSLAVDPTNPDTLYASILFRAFLTKSVDGGATWDVIAAFPDEIMDVAVDPSNPSNLYAAVFRGTPSGGSLWKSVDGGLNWTSITGSLFDPNTGRRHDVLRVAIDPAASENVYITTSGGGFKSTDAGATWTIIARAVMAIDPVTTTTLYAGTRGEGVFRSVDGGATWAAFSQGLANPYVNHIAVDPRSPEIVYAATDSGVFAIRVDDPTPPEVELTAPAAGATVSGTINVSAGASDDLGIAGVQFLLDGVPLGPEDTSAPYEVPWDARNVADGAHDLAARARDTVGNPTLSPVVTVTVANGSVLARSLRRLEEIGAALSPPDGWAEADNARFGVVFSGGRAVHASVAGATATFTFKGKGVRWLGFPCERCGVAELFIDGVRAATVDTFSPHRPASSQVIYTSPRLAMGTHSLTIEVTGTANTASAGSLVAVDAIEALQDGAGVSPSRDRNRR